ncbi:GAF domain-containing protein [Williamsia sp. SKLECPSW1]
MSDGWFLVETSGSTPAVVMVGPRSKQWRPVSNMFRGPVYSTVLHLLETVLNNLKPSQALLDIGGPRLAFAQPVLGPSRQVHAILMWIGEATETPPPEPPVWAWAWSLADRVSPEFVADPARGSMTDWLSGCARVADVRRTVAFVLHADVGDRLAGEWVRVDGTVERYAMRVVATFDGPYVLGVGARLPETLDPMDDEMIPRAVLTTSSADRAVALVDRDSNRVVAWLTDRRPTVGDGVVAGRDASRPIFTEELAGSPELRLAVFESAG